MSTKYELELKQKRDLAEMKEQIDKIAAQQVQLLDLLIAVLDKKGKK